MLAYFFCLLYNKGFYYIKKSKQGWGSGGGNSKINKREAANLLDIHESIWAVMTAWEILFNFAKVSYVR